MKHLFLSATGGCYRTEHLLSLYVDNQLTQKQVHEVQQHLVDCASCKAALAIMQATHHILVAREPIQPPAYLSERLRQAIAIEASRPQPAPIKRTLVLPRLAYSGAALAALTIFAFIALHHGSSTSPGQQAPGTPVATNVPSPLVQLQAIPHEPKKHELLLAHPRPSSAEVASLPRPETGDVSPVHLSIPYQTAGRAERTSQYSASRPESAEHTTIASSKSAHTNVMHSSETGPMIASAPPVLMTSPGAAAVITPAPEEQRAPIQSQPAANISIAVNPEEVTHESLYDRLRLQSVNTQSQAADYVEPARAEVSLASYSPGLSLVGSEIDKGH